MTKSHHFVASGKRGSLHGSINLESKGVLCYSVKEVKFVSPDGSYRDKGVTLFPFFSLDEIVNYYLDLGYSFHIF